ncbi:MAG: DUF3429 domain-containing protein [Pseudomonadota bacterium]
MDRIPFSAFALGLGGLVPFVWGAASAAFPGPFGQILGSLSPAFVGTALLSVYGTIILSFMSGVIWGFATKSEGRPADAAYLLSVMPAIYALALLPAPVPAGLIGLAIGFAALLVVDYWAYREGIAPGWWMKLRLLLTAIVVVCLGVGAYA